MMKEMLNKCVNGATLNVTEAEHVMDQIMDGTATPSQIASLISIMRFRGETSEEMIGFTQSMRAHMKPLIYEHENLIDTCGTGGDGASTFNISTTVAIVLSSMGLKVAKHGNRGVSSKSGSADVLEKLGIPTESSPEEAKRALEEKGMSFLFAPTYHAAMKFAASPRKELGFRTIFNLLGPLSNPAGCKQQMIGVYSTDYAEKMARTLQALGTKRALLVTGRDGLDECSIITETDVVELRDERITRYVLSPESVGLNRGNLEDLQVQSAAESAALITKVLQGEANESATNIVLLNAGSALYMANQAETIAEGVHQVKKALQSGTVYDHLLLLKEESRSC